MESKHLHEIGQIKLGSECYVIHKNKVLMFKRGDTAPRFPGYWIGPGGHVDDGENALTTILRELYEETGVKVLAKDAKLKVVAIHHLSDREEVFIVMIFQINLKSVQKAVDCEEGRAKWLPIKKILKMRKVLPQSKYYFDHILKNKKGILYTNIKWQGTKLVKINSIEVDTSN